MKKALSVFLIGSMTVALLSFFGCEKKDNSSINNKEKVENIVLPNEKDNTIQINLYFDSSSDNKSVSISKEERLINKEEFLGEIIVQELLKGPSNVSKLKPILPKGTKLLSFSIKDNIAYVNLSDEARITMSPQKEEATLRSLVNSLTELPSVKKVKIMLNNKDTDFLGGNYDVSKPIGKEDLETILKK
jgi:spore germination protein GerM